MTDESSAGATVPAASWLAVTAVGTGAFALVTTEFLPVGLLPQIARDLGVTEGQAGLMVTAPAFLAALAAPLTIGFAGRIDRRYVLWFFLAMLAVSNTLVATASGFATLLMGRVLLGIAVGGFWTMGASLGLRMRPGPEGARATSLILSGISLGTVAGVPAGTFVGDLLGWRFTFGAAAGLALLVLAALVLVLPRLAPQASTGLLQIPGLFRRPMIRIGLAASVLIFVGQFAAYTYIAPFLDQATHIDPRTLSLLLLGYGLTGFFGNIFGGWAVSRHVKLTLAGTTTLLGGAVLLLVLTGTDLTAAVTWSLVWGFGFGLLPIAIQSWIFAAAPDRLESVSALLVSVIQVALGSGALVGGLVVDHLGVPSALWLGGLCTLATTALIMAFGRERSALQPCECRA
ncbi:MAG TPA: MFS transporter [Hypericibacter adhaerens]|jgi:predicted MFS family arabinose efflux permease|uniref:MFS transporter n=1 Tax=Hypericibacter adhaerens TaxID=2602016 RepID=A0A5J6N4S6_9PROT|nr:MFS transporter [Hypericibacter adhaerens]QEX24434.1 MFS transporter [Hypericibacter adhaerens]HWA43269.1 MFS transporter [Hypericibacter adhaerens]